MKLIVLFALMPLFAMRALQAGTPSAPEPRCAFADERTMTLFGLYTFAAEHYLRHHAWPESRAELQDQAARLLCPAEAAKFFARLRRLELHRQGGDLRLSVHFRAAGRVYRQRAVLHPGRSTDTILQAATDPASPNTALERTLSGGSAGSARHVRPRQKASLSLEFVTI